ncbi:MAG: hypothetical protein IJH91_02150 [Mogibacterium sp.]|nr:hypothetical protein [Mogibacterium sp.]
MTEKEAMMSTEHVPAIVTIGIATLDIYINRKRMYPGGNELNVAFDVNQLGARSGFMGVFADDRIGTLLEQTLIDAGVDTSYSHHEHGTSGYAIVDIIDGDRVFLDYNKQGVTDLYPFTFTEEELEYIKTFDAASMSTGSRLTPDKIRKLAENGIRCSYDFSDSFTDADIDAIAPSLRFAFFSCSHVSEERVREVLAKAVDLGCEVAVATRGELPSMAFDGKRYYTQERVPVVCIDAMGAGDSYISGFLTNYLSQSSPEGGADEDKVQCAMQAAVQYAARVITREGALGIGYDIDPAEIGELIGKPVSGATR